MNGDGSSRSSRPAGTAGSTSGGRTARTCRDSLGPAGRGDACEPHPAVQPPPDQRPEDRRDAHRRAARQRPAARARWCAASSASPLRAAPWAARATSSRAALERARLQRRRLPRLRAWDRRPPVQALIFYYGSAQEFITEGVNAPVAADLTATARPSGRSPRGSSPPPTSSQPDGSRGGAYGPTPTRPWLTPRRRADPTDVLESSPAAPRRCPRTCRSTSPPPAPSARSAPCRPSTSPSPGSGGGDRRRLAGDGRRRDRDQQLHAGLRRIVRNAVSPGSPRRHRASTSSALPSIADVTGDGQPEVLEGGDSSVLHAFTRGGGQASGFPKFTERLDRLRPGHRRHRLRRQDRGDRQHPRGLPERLEHQRHRRRQQRVVEPPPRRAQHRPVRARHPPAGRPPQRLHPDRRLDASTGTAPGDDWYAGTPDHYALVTSSSPITPDNFDQATPLTAPPTAAAGTQQTFNLPAGTQRFVAMRAVDEAGQPRSGHVVRHAEHRRRLPAAAAAAARAAPAICGSSAEVRSIRVPAGEAASAHRDQARRHARRRRQGHPRSQVEDGERRRAGPHLPPLPQGGTPDGHRDRGRLRQRLSRPSRQAPAPLAR